MLGLPDGGGMRIVADVHERASGVPRLLAETGLGVTIRSLRPGDYAIGGGAIVERKTVRGMHAAIIAGTFWPQLGRLRRTARFSYLLVEGNDLDDGPLTPSAIRGACIAVTDLGVAVVRAADAQDAAMWLERLAQRRQRPYSPRSVSGIGRRKSAALAATFGVPHRASRSPRRGERHLAT